MNAAGFDRFLWRSRKEPPEQLETRMVPTRRVDVRVRDTGSEKPAVVFFCDPPVTVAAYDPLIEPLRNDFRVLVVELPGFGFSRTHHRSAYEFGQTVEAIEEVLGQLQTDRMVLCGPCVCGFVATELASRGRLPVKGLVLMQTPNLQGMLEWCERMDPKGVLRTPFVGQLVVRVRGLRLTRSWIEYASARSFDPADLVQSSTEALKKGAAFSLATIFQRWKKGPADGELDLPTLAVWGRQDRSHSNTDPECTLKHAPAAQVVSFDQCGHFTELEQPESFLEVAFPFISNCLR